jgi:hypothetical protein
MADATVVPAAPVITDTVVIIALAIIGVFILFLMIRELRLMKTGHRKLELELERDKLKILQQHAESRANPFTRMTAEQIDGIRSVEDENSVLGTSIAAKQGLVEARLNRLENHVKVAKLDGMLAKIDEEEKKVK